MKSFVKALWSRTKKDPESRQLDHVRDLLEGDLVNISDSYALPAQIRASSFKVVAVSTYQFEYEFETSFSLEGQDDYRIELLVEKEDGRERAAFSLSIDRDVVEQLFDLDQFSEVFDEDAQPVLELQQEPDDLAGWTAPLYRRQSCAERGYYYEQDYRGSSPPDEEGEGEPFDYYGLVSDDGDHAVDIEVWDTGETDVVLTIYRPISDIKELWPGRKE
jgi:hypothetical protein|tara:strand:- start:2281 stop:2934 length:654 start_codon:yes stop_codon:yes gene_type:complete